MLISAEDILQRYNLAEPIVSYLLKQNGPCEEISQVCEIAKGMHGQACVVRYKGKEMVAKRFFEIDPGAEQFDLVDLPKMTGKTLGEFLPNLIALLGLDQRISPEEILEYNGYSQNMRVNIDVHEILVPSNRVECLVTEPGIINNVFVSEGDYVCQSEAYTEYLNTLLLSNLKDAGISIHFLKCYGFSSCYLSAGGGSGGGSKIKVRSPNSPIQYLYLERAAGDLLKMRNWIENIDILAFQIFHSIFVMQKFYGMSHNDLSCGNILLVESPSTCENSWSISYLGSLIILKIPNISR